MARLAGILDGQDCSGVRQRRGRIHQGGGQPRLPAARFGERGLEAIDEGQQFINFGDDAVLFMADRKLWPAPF